ncbi:MAG TPA: hypothetical protein VIZ69_08115, partial [Thermoanaerobaculia bacterium]
MPTGAPSRRSTLSFRFPGTRGKRDTRENRDQTDGGGGPRPWRFWAWAIAYVLISTFSFAPSFTFRRSSAKPGEIASRDVVAPRDLIVPDAAATARRRVEASAEVLPVYDWDTGAPDRLTAEIRASFRKARAAEGTLRRKGALPQPVRDAFDLPIGDEALSALAQDQFSTEMEDRLIQTGADMYRAGVVDNREELARNRD